MTRKNIEAIQEARKLVERAQQRSELATLAVQRATQRLAAARKLATQTFVELQDARDALAELEAREP